MDYAKVKAIEKSNMNRWKKVCPTLTEEIGIYILTRTDELGIRYAYVGQSVNILKRLAQHLSGYQHIDLSIKKHGLYSENNPTGWSVDFITCKANELDAEERRYILEYSKTHQMRNKTSGMQGQGKTQMDNQEEIKGYYKGIQQGYSKALKEIKTYFEKYLDAVIKGKPNKTKERKLKEFEEKIK